MRWADAHRRALTCACIAGEEDVLALHSQPLCTLLCRVQMSCRTPCMQCCWICCSEPGCRLLMISDDPQPLHGACVLDRMTQHAWQLHGMQITCSGLSCTLVASSGDSLSSGDAVEAWFSASVSDTWGTCSCFMDAGSLRLLAGGTGAASSWLTSCCWSLRFRSCAHQCTSVCLAVRAWARLH